MANIACQSTQKNQNNKDMDFQIAEKEIAILGAGCFWCVEAVFTELEGVDTVISGYTGGEVKNPTYDAVCAGKTGHAEVCKIVFDPKKISYSDILEVFWRVHDPTTLNRQGNDVGTQYRSSIFYLNEKQKEIAEKSLKAAQEAELWEDALTTEITPLGDFYIAEGYHQNYFKLNPNAPYCLYVVGPKVDKFKKLFKEKLKD